MPKTRTRVPMLDFAGGVNEDDQPSALQPNELRYARNVYWRGRALSSRPGTDRLQTAAIDSGADGVGVWQLVRNQGVDYDEVAVFGDKFYEDAKVAGGPTNRTGTVTITAGPNNRVAFTHWNDRALMCNGVDTPWQWTGTGNATVIGGTPPAFGTMLSKWNRVFGAGHSAAVRTVRFSAVGDHESWPAANTVAAILGDSSSAIEGRDYIYQLGHLGDSIFVGLRNSLGRILYTGDSTTPFRYNQLSEFGCEGRFSYVSVGEMGYFLTQRGVHRIQPSDILITYESSNISGRRLRQTWDDLNKARIAQTYGTFYRTAEGNQLILWPLTSGSGTEHDIVLVMDITDGPGKERFTWWTGMNPNAMASVRNSSTQAEELLFTTLAGFVWQGDTGTSDEGAAFEADARTRWEDFSAPAEKKNFRDAYIEASQSGSFNLNLETYFDYSTTPSQRISQSLAGATQAAWGTAVWGTDLWPSLGFVREYLFGTDDGVVMSFRFFTSGADQPWQLFKFVPAVEATGESEES